LLASLSPHFLATTTTTTSNKLIKIFLLLENRELLVFLLVCYFILDFINHLLFLISGVVVQKVIFQKEDQFSFLFHLAIQTPDFDIKINQDIILLV